MNGQTQQTLENIKTASPDTLRAVVADLALAMIDVAREDPSRPSVNNAEKVATRSLRRVRTLLEIRQKETSA